MIGRKTFLHFLNTVLGALVGLLALKFIALYLGDSIYGQAVYAMTLTGVVHSVMQFALGQAHRKKLAEGIDEADRIGTFLWVQVGLMVAYMVLVAGLLLFRVQVQGKTFNDTTLLAVVVMGVYWATQFVYKWARTTLVATQEIARDQTADVAEDFVRAGGSALVAVSYAAAVEGTGPLAGMLGPEWAWLGTYGAEALAATYVAGSTAAVLIAAYFIVTDHEIGDFRPDIARDYWSFSRPLYFASLLGTLESKLDRLMLGYFWNDATVGLYYGADRLVSIVDTISFSVGALMLPEVSRLSVQEAEDRIVDVTYKAHRYTTMVVIPMVMGLAFFGTNVIFLILSAEFARGAPVVAVLATYTLFKVASSPYRSLVAGMDLPHLEARVSVVTALTNVALNLVLIPADIKAFGVDLLGLKALGAAIATLSSGALAYVYVRYLAGKVVDLRPQWHHFARQIAAGLLMIGFLKVVDARILPLVRWFDFLAYGLVGTPVYVAGMALLGEFDRDDLDFFLEVVHPGKMWDYLRSELFGDGD